MKDYRGEFDGYAVAERLLEGVIFDCHFQLTDDGEIALKEVSLKGPHLAFVESLGAKGTAAHWCNEVRVRIEKGLPWTFTEMFEEPEDLSDEMVDVIFQKYNV